MHFTQTDLVYMRRALELAKLGQGATAPNPMVGAVLVAEGRIIGEGYHQAYGGPHAEVLAVRSVPPEHRQLLPKSSLYVTLEPCSHYGKTPPCADLILQEGIPRVVVAQQDPFPDVAGRGIQRLREQGVEVCVGCLEDEAMLLNAAFNTRHILGRPFVLLKWAESADGFIDIRRDEHTRPYVFSSPYRLRLVHRLRHDYQAILVGFNTALLDNPSLTNRYWGKRQPIRIVLDRSLSLPQHLKLLSDGVCSTWVLHKQGYEPKTTHPHVRHLALDIFDAEHILQRLAAEGINSVCVEGGSHTLQMFLEHGLYDAIECEHSDTVLGEGVPAPHRLSLADI